MSAKIVAFGKRPKQIGSPMSKETRDDLKDLLLRVAVQVENGELSSLYLVTADLKDETSSWMVYHSDATNKILREINSLRKYAIERINGGEK